MDVTFSRVFGEFTQEDGRKKWRQNVCAWQTWQRYCLRVLSWSFIKLMFSGVLQVFSNKVIVTLSHKVCRLLSSHVLFSKLTYIRYKDTVPSNVNFPYFFFTNYNWVSEALVSDHPLLIYHAVAYESSFSKTTSSSYGYFFEFPRWSLTRDSTVFCCSAQRLPEKGVRYTKK